MIHRMSSGHEKPLRLRKKHGDGAKRDVTAEDGRRLVQAQSLRNAVTAGLITIILFCVLWVMTTRLLNSVYPWATVVLGYLLGFSVRTAGRGVDWPFPVLAAALTIVGSVAANVVVAASVSGEEIGIGTLQVLHGLTATTWTTFFNEIWNIGDTFFAAFAAGVAAFFAPRKLNRNQYYALRLYREAVVGE